MLQVRLLGGVAADHDGELLSLLPPVSRLLAVLALRPGPQDRETVAATLWPGAAGPAARANLRTAVWALRKAVGDDALITSRAAVGLRPEAITVDLADAQRAAAAGDAAAAAALCRGELLPGYAEDWAETARRRGGPSWPRRSPPGPRPPSATVTRPARHAGHGCAASSIR